MDNSLSYDNLSQILAYLPAKSISKLRSTNKYLTSNYTSNEFFFLSQSNKCQVDSGFLITNSYSSQIFFFDQHSGIPKESMDLVQKTPKILASSNGLVFCKNENESTKSIYGYNLVHKTRCFVPSNLGNENLCEIPFMGLQVVYYGDMSSDYKLVCVIPNEEWSNIAHVRIFDSRQNGWIEDEKSIDLGPRNVDLESSVALGNTIFWVSDCGSHYWGSESYVLAFNVESEKSWFISVPKEISLLDSQSGVKIAKKDDETLCLVRFCNVEKSFTIWATKIIGESAQRFEVVNRIHLADMVEFENENVIISAFGLMRGGDILVFVMGFKEVYAYSFQEKMVKKIGETFLGYATLRPYANTLRPCGKYESVETY